MSKETSLIDIQNYKETLSESSAEVIEKFTNIVIEYLHCMTKYESDTKKNYIKFVLLRGLEAISHIFIFILYYTKNSKLAEYHSQKSIYYYLEFIGQITEDKHIFLQLTSQDAVIYIYKKSIYDLQKKHIITATTPTKFIQTMSLLEKIAQVYKNVLSENESIILTSDAVSTFEQICQHFIKIKDPTSNQIFKFEQDVSSKLC